TRAGWLWGAQILLRNTADAAVTGNRVAASVAASGIGLMQQAAADGGAWLACAGNSVLGNVIDLVGDGIASGAVADVEVLALPDAGNRFDGNRYTVSDPTAWRWEWRGRCDWDAFRAAGHEASGTCALREVSATPSAP
ncbi:MAG: hypothetical protein H0X45_03430, partial [Planctomycetes bacterium]|nr:hypothetical protein [Planctomycetota bacterium]